MAGSGAGDGRTNISWAMTMAKSGSGKKTSAEMKRLAWMLKYGRSESRLSERKKPKAITPAKWISASCGSSMLVIRHCSSSSPASSASDPAVQTTATSAANRLRAASSAAMRRNNAAMPRLARRARAMDQAALAESGRATNASVPCCSSRAVSAPLISARKRQNAVPA